MRYTRSPSIFSDSSLSASFLRTTAAKNPPGASHDRRNGGAARPAQQSQHPRLLRIRPPVVPPLWAAFGRTLVKDCALAVRPRLRLDMQNSSHSCRCNIAPTPPKPRRGGEE
jgi:hypothetical protein